MSKELKALETIRKALEIAYPLMYEYENEMPEYIDLIEKELILLNALRNKLNRKVETKEYKHEASNGYRIATLLTYELKEQWDDKELQALKQFLLNLSGISKELKALEIIKEKFEIGILHETCNNNLEVYQLCSSTARIYITQEEYDLLKEVLL